MAETLKKIPSANTINKDKERHEGEHQNSLKTLQKVQKRVKELRNQQASLKDEVAKRSSRINYLSNLNNELTTKLEDLKKNLHMTEMAESSNKASGDTIKESMLQGLEIPEVTLPKKQTEELLRERQELVKKKESLEQVARSNYEKIGELLQKLQ